MTVFSLSFSFLLFCKCLYAYIQKKRNFNRDSSTIFSAVHDIVIESMLWSSLPGSTCVCSALHLAIFPLLCGEAMDLSNMTTRHPEIDLLQTSVIMIDSTEKYWYDSPGKKGPYPQSPFLEIRS